MRKLPLLNFRLEGSKCGRAAGASVHSVEKIDTRWQEQRLLTQGTASSALSGCNGTAIWKKGRKLVAGYLVASAKPRTGGR